jgi:hypothetical protein
MNNKLKELKIERCKKFGVGKKISNQIWIHKNYILDVIDNSIYKEYLKELPNNYEFNLLRVDLKINEIAFINSPDFDSSQEPLVGSSIRITKDNNNYKLSKIQNPPNDPLIYHHKWLFVKDDYKNFNIKESKKRSIEWKEKLGIDRAVSSRIGRLSFWNNWLENNNLGSRIMEEKNVTDFLSQKVSDENISDIWDIYTNNNIEQSVSSAKTSRIQTPRSLGFIKEQELNKNTPILLDIGCGIGSERFSKELNDIGVEYFGCDPFNKNQKDNLTSIKKCMNGKSDLVTLNSVLNTIPEQNIWLNVLKQAENALNSDTGILTTVIYEGEKLASEKKNDLENNIKTPLTPIKTRDGWQNRMKTSEYLPVIKSVFPNSRLVSIKNGKAIISSKNPRLDLSIYDKSQKKIKNKP